MATVRYLVQDLEASLPFYQRLGFELSGPRDAGFAVLRRSDLTLWLSGPSSSAARALDAGAKPAPGGWNRLVLEVPDLDAFIRSLGPLSTRLRGRPVTGPAGRHSLIDDPSGNPVELFQAASDAAA